MNHVNIPNQQNSEENEIAGKAILGGIVLGIVRFVQSTLNGESPDKVVEKTLWGVAAGSAAGAAKGIVDELHKSSESPSSSV